MVAVSNALEGGTRAGLAWLVGVEGPALRDARHLSR